MSVEEERAKRMRQGLKFYLVFMDPVEGAGDRSSARAAHFSFAKDLAAKGHLFAGGPLIAEETGKPQGRGIWIVSAASRTDAEELVRNDPFVTGGFRRYSIEPWRINEGRIRHLLG